MKRNINVANSSSNPNFINYYGTAKEFSDTKNSIQEGTLSDLLKNNIIVEEQEMEQEMVVEQVLVIDENEIIRE